MKTILLLISFTLLVSPFTSKAQNPNLVALFGVDGDVRSGMKLNGTFAPENTHDWFYKSSGSNIGVGIIDTTGAAYANSQLAAGNNFVLTRGMSVPRYSVVDGKLLLDARYARDNVGLSATFKDSTIFTTGAKNGMMPSAWGTNINGFSVTDKVDIVDGYAHMRRNGTIINSTNPSQLILVMGASTNGTSGNRFIDIELFKSRIEYSRTTGIFLNSGPVSTGGHSVWTFDASGNLTEMGDMDFAFAFSSAQVTDVSVYVWVAKTTVQNINPSGFDFVGLSEFYGDGSNPDYGYAKIIGNSGASFPVWSSVNTATINGPVWGTASKDIGAVGSSYYSAQYGSGQLAEIAIDLTAIGIDPALNQSKNPCSPPFTRMMIKSRSSETFSSSLQDFLGPYLFLDAPDVPATIISPAVLKCNVPSVTLAPQSISSGAYYNWTTNDGVITTNPLNPSITVTKAGKYYLNASIYVGCTQNIDSVIVGQDIHKPVASITQTGILYTPNANYDSVTLLGGNIAASNYTSAYGSFQGLLWSWTGSHGLNATTQNVIVADSGYQRLIVTNISNGCKDTAGWYLMDLARPPLSVNLVSFTAALNNSKVDLQWSTTSEKNASHFVIEKSIDGKNFTDAGTVIANGTTLNKSNYNFQDNTGSYSGVIYYRLRQVEISGKIEYSGTRIVRTVKQSVNTVAVLLYPNPATDEVRIAIPNNWQNKRVVYELYNASGQIAKRMETSNSSQTEKLNIMSLAPGFYIVRVSCDGVVAQQKIVKN